MTKGRAIVWPDPFVVEVFQSCSRILRDDAVRLQEFARGLDLSGEFLVDQFLGLGHAPNGEAVGCELLVEPVTQDRGAGLRRECGAAVFRQRVEICVPLSEIDGLAVEAHDPRALGGENLGQAVRLSVLMRQQDGG